MKKLFLIVFFSPLRRTGLAQDAAPAQVQLFVHNFEPRGDAGVDGRSAGGAGRDEGREAQARAVNSKVTAALRDSVQFGEGPGATDPRRHSTVVVRARADTAGEHARRAENNIGDAHET